MNPSIRELFKDRTILITGATGFMGKILLEKLLYSCPDIAKIYLLLRPKRDKCQETRISDMFQLPLFQRVCKERPNAKSKLIAIPGDLSAEYLGLSDEHKDLLQKECSIVFHMAAALNMKAPLQEALTQNTIATKKITELAKGMKNLISFVHLSTTFCFVDYDIVEEKMYDPPANSKLILNNKFLDDTKTDKLIYPHPNTYTFTKRLTEGIINEASKTIPIAILRPSIVLPVWKEPIPGWVDNLNGPVGLSAAAGMGIMRTMICNPKYHSDLIPVDIAINAMIIAAWRRASDKNKKIHVYNVTTDKNERVTWGENLELGKAVVRKYPFNKTIWYPDGEIRTNAFIHNFCVLFYHYLPALLIDFLLTVFLQKRFMWKLQEKISAGVKVLQYFTSREWQFKTDNFKNLKHLVTAEENEIFYTDTPKVDDQEEIVARSLLGVREFIFKEDPSTLPYARRRLKILYWLRHLFWFFIYLRLIYWTLSWIY